MKKHILSILSILALTVSCQDAYEIDQPGYVTEESQVFTNNASIQRGINALYNTISTQTEIEFGSIFTDEVGLGYQNGGQGINDGSFNFVLESGNTAAATFWSSNYNIINRINRMLSVVDVKIENNDSELDELKKSKAELLALRAFANLKLFSYFTPDYTNPQGLSIMKLDFLQTDDYNVLLPRATVSEIVAFIEKDIQDARNLRYNAEEFGGDNTYVSKAFVNSILVKLYSMTENYDGVIANAEEIINSNSYFLNDGTNFLFMFNDNGLDDNSEIIFRLKRVVTQGGGVANIWFTNRPNISGSVLFEIGRSLYNEIDKLDPENFNKVDTEPRRDIRYQVLVHSDSEVAINYSSLSYDEYIDKDRLLVGKYLGRTQAIMQNDIMMFRTSDILLALAEARAAQGTYTGVNALNDFSTVSSIIYNIRRARINTMDFPALEEPAAMPTITSEQSAWQAILNERRIEFAFEGHRYLDVKRLGTKAGVGFVRDPQDCVRNSACELDPNDYKMTLPIPRAEVIANPNIAQNQNPGY